MNLFKFEFSFFFIISMFVTSRMRTIYVKGLHNMDFGKSVWYSSVKCAGQKMLNIEINCFSLYIGKIVKY